MALEPGGAEGREWKFPAGPSRKEAAGLRSWEEPGESWTRGLPPPSRQKGLFTQCWQEEGGL